MKTLLLTLCLLVSAPAVYVSTLERVPIPESGLCVVEFNASFNSSNRVTWLDELSDCLGRRVDISDRPDLQAKHQIVVLPTLIIFNEGEEVKRFQGNIMMELEATFSEVQEAVDDAIMSSF